MKNRNFQFIVMFLLFMAFGTNLNAVTKEIEDYDTPKMEEFEREVTDETTPKIQARASVGLSIPTEGVYDTVKDTKNSTGVLTERRYYYKSKLVEKRTYTSTASSDCRMRNKYLYFSDGKTVERHRTYGNTKDVCYNLQTKVYTDQSKLKSHTIYEGKVNGQITEIRTYDISGKYYIGKSFYKKGIVYKKEYWLGEIPNRITHIANFNSKGTNWTDATYYDTDGDKTSYVKYAGTEPNKKVYTLYYDKQTQEKINSTSYDETGKYVDFKTIWKDGKKVERTYYNKNEEGNKERTLYYFDGGNIVKTEISYQENHDFKDIETKRNEQNQIVEIIYYESYSNNVSFKEEYNNEILDKTYLYENGILEELFKHRTDEELDWSLTYKIDNESSQKDIKIFYNDFGNVERESLYDEHGLWVKQINYYNDNSSLIKIEHYEEDSLINSEDIEVNVEKEEKDRLDFERELEEKNEELNNYVDIDENIEFTDENIELFINDELGIANEEEKENAKIIIKDQISSINTKIDNGDVYLLNTGELVERNMLRGGKTTKTKLYWWGTIKKFSTSAAKKQIKKDKELVKTHNKHSMILNFYALSSIPSGIAKILMDYLIEQTKIKSNKMKKVNDSTKKGIVVEAYWTFTCKVYKQK